MQEGNWLALGEQPTARISTIGSITDTKADREISPGIDRQGSITAFYTVLADGDDENDPVVDTARHYLMDILYYQDNKLS